MIEVTVSEVRSGKRLTEQIANHGFSINHSKVILRGRPERMEVTGLTVNDFPNVTRRYVDELRGMLTAWKNHGLAAAQVNFEKKGYQGQWRTEREPTQHQALLTSSQAYGHIERPRNQWLRRHLVSLIG